MATQRGDKQARRRDILEAGRAELRAGGLAGMQMRQVARRAGVALGTVYTYFATKEALYATLYAEALDRMLADVERALVEKAGDPEEMFVAFASCYREMYAEFGKELDVFTMLGSKTQLDPDVLAQLVEATTRLMNIIRQAMADYEVERPDLTLVLLWSTASGLAEHFTGPRHIFHGLSWDDTVRYAAHTFARSLLPIRKT
ncbi:TetR/AcrR family transcriptional regulator [Nocardia otitidiscaviarum]|uniref:TetR/AcrR family transcriptional regulator n=1 Tax=Nocardia otitidiscaviarum TaxID=1823 RepID=UPI00130EF541|nr:TetR/AcrR family transcriptional regulator [Nocardia otitidiscaviarum]MBF6135033.1 TetR/AcrR family transcriptional regulator [Nocardia otitidiscaviarum]MBF6486856.1 TetR/AcrR family transcriptional regulator [Nocardia otitidiscaviarum]